MKRIPIMLLALLAGIGNSLAQGPQSWYTLATSRTGDTVRLNDLEPHSWSYYTAASPIHSLNPVDVRIAYYGNGQCYSSTSATPSGALTAVSGVKVGVNENKRRYCTGFHLRGCCICRGFWRPSIHHHRRHHPGLDCRWLQRNKNRRWRNVRFNPYLLRWRCPVQQQ